MELDEDDPNYAEYKRILERFNVTDVSLTSPHYLPKNSPLTNSQDDKANEDKGEVMYPEDEMMPFEEDEKPEAPKLSKKARKARDKLSVAELKVRCHAPPSLPHPHSPKSIYGKMRRLLNPSLQSP